jgi:hypothetical protein
VLDHSPNSDGTPGNDAAAWERSGTDSWQPCVNPSSALTTDVSPIDLFACLPLLRDLPIHGCREVVAPTSQDGSVWTVAREPDTVVDGAFYYEGVRVFTFGTKSAPAQPRMYVGGGFSEGEPVRFEISGVTWAREL